MSTLEINIGLRGSLEATARGLTERDDYDIPHGMLAYFFPDLTEQEREDRFSALLRAVVAVDAKFWAPDTIDTALDELTGVRR